MADDARPEVTIMPDGVKVTVAEGETLLRALARAGLRYRVGCKRGGCGICKVQLLAGEVTYERPIAPQVLSDDERVEGICLSCRAVPLTNIVIELQEGDKLRRVLGFAVSISTPGATLTSSSSVTSSSSRSVGEPAGTKDSKEKEGRSSR
jgi:CDP-4-dehydro-6-deoxyglucose reductase